MNIARNVVAVDFGAESGRLALCRWNGTEGTLEEVHRFPNAPKQVGNHLVWDMEGLWGEIIRGLLKAAAKTGGHLDSVGIDGWGVDYALLDAEGKRIGHSYCYRDARNVPAMEKGAFPNFPGPALRNHRKSFPSIQYHLPVDGPQSRVS